MDESGEVRFQVLGPVTASRDGTAVSLGGPQQRLVLALLLANFGNPITTSRLIDGVWEEAPPATARKTLQVYVSRLRAALGEGTVESALDGYRVVGRLDAKEFEERAARGRERATRAPREAGEILAEALAMWVGSPYAGVEHSQSLYPEIVRLEELRISTLGDRVAADLETGSSAALVGELESLTREYPLQERFRAQLMLALYRSGRQADALRVFSHTRDRLVEELGVEPGPELWQLEQRILDQDPSLLVQAEETSDRARLRAIRGYELRELVGAGESSRVYRAFDRGASRTVTVKVVDPAMSGQSDYIEAFEPTAQLISKLEHPHVLSLDDYWREPDGAYLVSTWTDGGSLRDALGGGRPWASGPALTLIDQIGSALAYAHRNGVVHGGVKPENIVLGDDGSAFLADFPMVVRREGAYAAPEVLGGDHPTPRSDVYSFGLVIHELFIGALPQRNLPSRLLSPGLQDVIARAVAAAPGERHERIEDVLRDIRRATGSDVVAIAGGHEPRSRRVRNPFKGLRAFQEIDADDFFGRDEQIELTLDKAAHQRLVAVVGPSGSGKSSLVKAGVLPRLRAGVRQRPALITEMFPGNYPFEELESALRRVAVEWPDRGVVGDLTADSRGLLRVVKQILPDDSELVLVIDQFEELFSLLDDEATRALFLESLATVVDDAHSRTVVIITLRADFFDRPLTYPPFGMLLEQGVVPVTVPSRQALAQAVSQPARRAGIDLEEGLVADIVSDFEDQPGALPLMQFTLTEMVDTNEGDRLTVEDYRSRGGIGGAVGSRAEEVYLNLAEGGKRAVKQALLRLVRVDEEGAYTRRRVRQTELAALDVDQPALMAALRDMASHRLLTFDRDPITRGATLEVAHEALLESWPRLRKWIGDRRHDLLLHHRYIEARREWITNETDDSFLLTGGRLGQFETWAEETELRLTPDELAFLDQSRSAQQAKDRRQRRVRVGVTGMVAVLVALGLVFGATARAQRAASEREEILRMAESALATVERSPERSMLVALAAADRSRALDGAIPARVEEALHESLLRSRLVMTAPRGGALTLSRDGSMLAVGEGDGGVSLLDPKDLGPVGDLAAVGRPIEALAFGSGAESLFGVDDEGNVYQWDLAEPGTVNTLIPAEDDTRASWFLDISSDDTYLAVGHDESTQVVIHHLQGAERVATLDVDSPTCARFSPDASTLAVSTTGGDMALYDTSTWTEDARWQPRRNGDAIRTAVTQVNWSPRGDRLVIATEIAGTYVVEAGLDPAPRVDAGLFPRTVQFDETGTRIVIGDTDGTARLLDVTDPSDPRLLASLGGHVREVTGGLFAPDGANVITTSNDGTTRLWDPTPTGQREYLTLMAHSPEFPTGTPAFSPDGSRLITKSGNAGEATVWDTSNWEPITTISGLPGTSGQLVFSPDGDTVAVTQGESPSDVSTVLDPRLKTIPTRVGIFDAATGELLVELGGHTGHVTGRAFSPDGRRLVTAGLDGTVILWDLTSGTMLDSELSTHGRMNLLTYHPQGDRVVVGNEDGTFTIWDVIDTGRLEIRRTVEAHNEGFVFARFSPDGERIATTAADGSGKIWSAQGEFMTQLDGHTSIVWNLGWTPDGEQLVTVSLDGTLRTWNPVTGDLRVTVTALGIPAGASVSPEGLMAVGAGRGTVYLLTLDTDQLIELARERAQPRDCVLFEIDPCPVP